VAHFGLERFVFPHRENSKTLPDQPEIFRATVFVTTPCIQPIVFAVPLRFKVAIQRLGKPSTPHK